MVDGFDAENGATRFVPGSHLQPQEPGDVMPDPQSDHDAQVLACGAAGSLIIFNASVWHGHGANRSAKPRRSIQAHFCRREARSAPEDHSRGMRPETLQRLSDLAKYVLNV
jgi:ectoine hydroxylase-related dioxygenase (phytanoyl-CoA dioxygenase family)